jgi:hypothetical protein
MGTDFKNGWTFSNPHNDIIDTVNGRYVRYTERGFEKSMHGNVFMLSVDRDYTSLADVMNAPSIPLETNPSAFLRGRNVEYVLTAFGLKTQSPFFSVMENYSDGEIDIHRHKVYVVTSGNKRRYYISPSDSLK